MSKLQAAEFLGQLIAFLLLNSNVVSGTIVKCHQGFILLAIFIGHLICYQLKEALQQGPDLSATQLTHMHRIGQSSKCVHHALCCQSVSLLFEGCELEQWKQDACTGYWKAAICMVADL